MRRCRKKGERERERDELFPRDFNYILTHQSGGVKNIKKKKQ